VALVFELSAGASTAAYPGTVPSGRVDDLITNIANRSGISASEVHLKLGSYAVSGSETPPEQKGGYGLGTSGFLWGMRALPEGPTAVRVCAFDRSIPIQSTAAQDVLDPGETLLTALTISNRKLVLAIRMEERESFESWSEHAVATQQALNQEWQGHYSGPFLPFAFVQAPHSCNP
jgi:hypothetical protein